MKNEIIQIVLNYRKMVKFGPTFDDQFSRDKIFEHLQRFKPQIVNQALSELCVGDSFPNIHELRQKCGQIVESRRKEYFSSQERTYKCGRCFDTGWAVVEREHDGRMVKFAGLCNSCNAVSLRGMTPKLGDNDKRKVAYV